MAKASYVAGFLLAALFFIGGIQLCSSTNSTSAACIQPDRNSLLMFKASLQDPSNLLSSWEGQDCCRWKGVSCDHNTGHVIKLDLSKSISDPWCRDSSPNITDGLLGLGKVSISLTELKHLKYLDLSGNNFEYSEIPKFFGSLNKLRYLNLSCTHFSGKVPHQLGNLTNLQVLALEGYGSQQPYADNFRWASSLLSLQHLDMSGVDLGSAHNLMEVLTGLPSLQNLQLSGCGINNTHFQHALLQSMSLSYLDLSLNQISGPLPSNFGDVMPSLQRLFLSDNRINGSIPNSLCRLNDLGFLDLSRNMLHGKIPHCWTDSLTIQYIDLSSNKLSGTIPASIGNLPSLMQFNLNNNSLSGKLPLALINCSSLISMDLGQNKLSGSIPTWIGENFLDLRILRLRENRFIGTIPLSLCRLTELQVLELGYNSLMGRIPLCFSNLRGMITVNSLSYEYDETVVQFLEYTGNVLPLVANMDLSCNKLVGHIPDELTTLVGLRGLNLSHNNLSGSIPRNIGNITSLESLDLSDNQFSGTIPNSMSILTSLSHLNLSHNKLSGKIPKGNQLQTLDPSIYAGNLKLCGDPLPDKCPADEEQVQPSLLVQPPMSIGFENEEHGEGKSENYWFYVDVYCGYATGLWGVFGILIVKKNWRIAYFQYAENAKDWILVMVAVLVARLKRKMERNNNGTE